ncbi:receptor/non-receptor type protein-tyrosine phosphatase, partial [Ramicandelaber brevisporus]
NRYPNIWPFDHTRVKLRLISQPADNINNVEDYINASFVNYSGDTPRYIVTQGPLAQTVIDFWRMVWQQGTRVIVMLTKENETRGPKCHRYWSDNKSQPLVISSNSMDSVGEFSIRPLFPPSPLSADSNIIRRRMLLVHLPSGKQRDMVHLQYLGWDDHSTPNDPSGVLRLREEVRRATREAKRDPGMSSAIGPTVVHCSAGCGRAGAFCALDTAIMVTDRINNGKNEDVMFNVVRKMREQRMSMVQTLRQFVFCYEAL